MIVTITCNPAIDKTIIDNKTVFEVGGKGINVSKTLKLLNTSSIATGLIGKKNKDIIINRLNNLGISNYFIEIEGNVRTNTKIIKNGVLTEENENGPIVNINDINNLLDYLKQFHNQIVTISGSISSNVDTKIYGEMIKQLKANNNYVIVDCSGELLKYAIDAKPNVIKPNRKEICDYFKIDYDEEIIIDKTKQLGLDLVCVSLDKDGALFIGDCVYKADAIDINCINSVGAGDAMVSAIAYSIENKLSMIDMIKLSMACSAACCLTNDINFIDYSTVKELINKVKISIL